MKRSYIFCTLVFRTVWIQIVLFRSPMSMLSQMLTRPFRRPATFLALISLSRKPQTFPTAHPWVGAESTPGNSRQIHKWRTLGRLVQILRPPYQTAHIAFLASFTIFGWGLFELNTSWLQAHLQGKSSSDQERHRSHRQSRASAHLRRWRCGFQRCFQRAHRPR